MAWTPDEPYSPPPLRLDTAHITAPLAAGLARLLSGSRQPCRRGTAGSSNRFSPPLELLHHAAVTVCPDAASDSRGQAGRMTEAAT